jgi:hypothetical protein
MAFACVLDASAALRVITQDSPAERWGLPLQEMALAARVLP